MTQTDQPAALCGSHVGHGWTCVQVPDPRWALLGNAPPRRQVLNEHTLTRMACSADAAPATECATSGPLDPTSSAAPTTGWPHLRAGAAFMTPPLPDALIENRTSPLASEVGRTRSALVRSPRQEKGQGRQPKIGAK